MCQVPSTHRWLLTSYRHTANNCDNNQLWKKKFSPLWDPYQGPVLSSRTFGLPVLPLLGCLNFFLSGLILITVVGCVSIAGQQSAVSSWNLTYWFEIMYSCFHKFPLNVGIVQVGGIINERKNIYIYINSYNRVWGYASPEDYLNYNHLRWYLVHFQAKLFLFCCWTS